MKIRVGLIDFMGVCNGQLAGEEWDNVHRSVREEAFLRKYRIDRETLEKTKLAAKKGEWRVVV